MNSKIRNALLIIMINDRSFELSENSVQYMYECMSIVHWIINIFI